MNTICSLVTPFAKSAVAVIRLSGDNALNIIKKCFIPLDKNCDYMHSKLYLGDFRINTGIEFYDRCLVVAFYAPKSYTGEDCVEIQCHGSIAVIEGILHTLQKNGAVLAVRGEFSKRAFLNGKLDLTALEGICDLITSENSAMARASSQLSSGELFQRITKLQGIILDILSYYEVILDYPDEQIQPKKMSSVITSLEEVQTQLDALTKSYGSGKKLSSGIKVVLAGETNVGKSSLFNALLGFDRAIVSNIQGTTRDTIESSYEYNGVNFTLVDTAGIRNSDDEIEKIGIDKTLRELTSGDIILLLSDSENYSQTVEDLLMDKTVLKVISKADLHSERKQNLLYISSVNGENIQLLKQKIYDLTIHQNIENELIITNERHYGATMQSLKYLQNLLENFANKSHDIVALELHTLWQEMGKITGSTLTEEVIDNIFAKFCLGK